MSEFDSLRARSIADEIPVRLEQHATLLAQLARTDNPLFRDVVQLSRRWWLFWLASGLHDIAHDPEREPVEAPFCDRLAVFEAAIVERAGPAGFDAFMAWARQHVLGYSEPPYLRGGLHWGLALRQSRLRLVVSNEGRVS